MRIAILSISDNAGSGQRYAEALREAGHEALLFTRDLNIYGYPVDVQITTPAVREQARAWIAEADVLHFKGDQVPGDYTLHFPLPGRMPKVVTVSGSGFRRMNGTQVRWAQEWYPISEYLEQCHVLTAITPDLLAHDAMKWMPHAFPVPQRNPYRAPRLDETIIIGHSPSKREVKGTDTIFLPAVDLLKQQGHNVRVLMIEGHDNATALELKARCHLFFDQGNIPAYGISAVEAMAMGIPVCTYLPATTHAHMHEAWPGVPMINRDAIDAAACMGTMIQDLRGYSRAFHRYALKVHSYPAAAGQLLGLYQEAISKRSRS